MVGPLKMTSRSFTLTSHDIRRYTMMPSAAMAREVGGQVRSGRAVTSVYGGTL